MQSTRGEELRAGSGRQVGGESAGHRGGGSQPEGAAGERGGGGDEVGGQLLRERMDDEARVTVGEVADDLRILLLVTAHRAHRGQAARHGVRAGRDGLPKGQRRKDGGTHGTRRFYGAEGDDNSGFCHVTHPGLADVIYWVTWATGRAWECHLLDDI